MVSIHCENSRKENIVFEGKSGNVKINFGYVCIYICMCSFLLNCILSFITILEITYVYLSGVLYSKS